MEVGSEEDEESQSTCTYESSGDSNDGDSSTSDASQAVAATLPAAATPEEDDEEDDYVVDKIINHRRNVSGELEYLIEFVGYKEPEWLKRSAMCCTAKIRQYYQTLKDTDWKRKIGGATAKPYVPLRGRTPGPQEPYRSLAKEKSKLPLFYKFFTPYWWSNLSKGTNHQMRHKLEKKKAKSKRKLESWETSPTTVQELKVFYALLICMSIVVEPEIHNYWAVDSPIHGGHKFITTSGMSRNRYRHVIPHDV